MKSFRKLKKISLSTTFTRTIDENIIEDISFMDKRVFWWNFTSVKLIDGF